MTIFVLTRKVLKAFAYALVGGSIVFLIGFVAYLESRSDLKVWHTADLDEEFTTESRVQSFSEYLELEERLFAQLDRLVLDRIEPEDRRKINRFNRGSSSDPGRWSPNWNRSFEFAVGTPRIGVLLLHGMSDSPYSLRSIGQRLHAEGAWVVGLRLPGHGTAPSGLLNVTWQDIAAATRLALLYLKSQVGDRPLFIIGYSNGGALAVHYALEMLENPSLPSVDGLVLVSPSIGVPSVAALAIWQARLSKLLGFPKLEWSSISLEYDPFKYGSFAINAGDVVYRLTREIKARLHALKSGDLLTRMPPILAFQSVVDATVSTPALIDGLFRKLPDAGHELVLFDTDRSEEVQPLLTEGHESALASLAGDDALPFTLSLITNESGDSERVVVRRRLPKSLDAKDQSLGNEWPENVFSLSHVALPFSPSDPLYGRFKPADDPKIYLGDLTLRGEKGLFRVSPAELLRLRWNPFYPYFEQRVLDMMQ